MSSFIRSRIPQDVNLEKLFSYLPTHLRNKKTVQDRTIHQLHLFTSRSYADKKYSDQPNTMFLPFPQEYIRKITTTKYEKAIMDALLKSEIVECNGFYFKGIQSFCYRINPKYTIKTKLINIENKSLKKTLRNNFEVKSNKKERFNATTLNAAPKTALIEDDFILIRKFIETKSDYEVISAVRDNHLSKFLKPKMNVDFELTENAYSYLSIDEVKALDWIDANVKGDFKKEKYLYYVDRIMDKTYNITLGNKVNRLYSIFTNLPSALLQFIKIEAAAPSYSIYNNIDNIYGVTFTEIDASNCQPLLLNSIISDEFSEALTKADVCLYKKLTESGNLYQFLYEKMQTKGEFKDFKIELFKHVFFSNRKKKICKYNAIVKKYFPTVYDIIYKVKESYSLPARLQNIEADIFVNANQLFLKKGIWNLTRHDSIICPKENAEQIQKYLLYVFHLKYNLNPSFKAKEIN